MRFQSSIAVLGTLVLLGGTAAIADRRAGPKPGASREAPRERGNVAAPSAALGRLHLRSRLVTVHSGGRYTVTTRDGQVLADRVTLQQLKAIDPSLQQQLENTVAVRGAFTWAGM